MMKKKLCMYLNMLHCLTWHININTKNIYLILFLLEYATDSYSKNDTILFSVFSSNNVTVSKTSFAIVDLSDSTTKEDFEKFSEEDSIHHNNFKIKEYIDSVCMDKILLWEPKLLINVWILSQKYKDYGIIKHVNEDMSYIIYFDPSKYSVKDGFNRDGYSLLCNDTAVRGLKEGYQRIENGYYTIRCSTIQRFFCNRCDWHIRDVEYCSSKSLKLKSFHNDAKYTCGIEGRKMGRRVYNKFRFSSLNQIWFIWFWFGS